MIKTTIVVNLICCSDADINAGQCNAKIHSGPKNVWTLKSH